MKDNKQKRFDYLKANKAYLSKREKQEYYELLEEIEGYQAMEEEYAADLEEERAAAEGSSYERRSRSDRSSIPKTGVAFSSLGRRKKAERDRTADDEEMEERVEKKPKKKKSWFKRILFIILAILLIMVGFFIYGYQRGASREGGAIKAEAFNGVANSDGSVNILLLGADQRPGQSSGVAHSDSIMVLNVGRSGKMQLVSFMRDTLVNIPGVGDASQGPNMKINAAFTIGEQNENQGVELVRQTLQQNFGINCKYYAVVDFSSFATVIDSMFPAGVEIDAKFSTINGQKFDEVPVPDDLAETEGMASNDKQLSAEEAAALGYPDGGGIFMMIKQGKQRMNGRTLLNYARFRHDDQGDFGRVQRQQQVLETLTSKMKNPLTLFTGSSAMGTARAVTMTNVPNTFLLTKALPAMFGGMENTTIPSDNDWQDGYDMYGGSGILIDLNKYSAKAQEILGN
ncbi:LCP family protein [Lactococcus garvieae]|jgi:anionic cell wall polymer biosynthesis LytR-Cps2A-Psr (LCP) family protein|uniref:LCP family protein n=1 Tax=Lactococcus garvieae TaxID=1363 RepID=UPI0018D864C1|nr:LCP family protein [Lactococcus garvieae]QPS71292.1 LCP family protein [Lactococcus garvieae]